VHSVDAQDRIPLHLAAANGHTDIAQLLLAAQNLSAEAMAGAAQAAAEACHEDLAILLLKALVAQSKPAPAAAGVFAKLSAEFLAGAAQAAAEAGHADLAILLLKALVA
jgi:ankyrin repeat protein